MASPLRGNPPWIPPYQFPYLPGRPTGPPPRRQLPPYLPSDRLFNPLGSILQYWASRGQVDPLSLAQLPTGFTTPQNWGNAYDTFASKGLSLPWTTQNPPYGRWPGPFDPSNPAYGLRNWNPSYTYGVPGQRPAPPIAPPLRT